jgi:hypothetical protein
MIKGFCRCNDEAYEREVWPQEFVAVPRIGDRVCSKGGRKLKVASICHWVRFESADSHHGEPMIEVELGK